MGGAVVVAVPLDTALPEKVPPGIVPRILVLPAYLVVDVWGIINGELFIVVASDWSRMVCRSKTARPCTSPR